MTKKGAKRRSYLVTKVEEIASWGTTDTRPLRTFLKYNPAKPELRERGKAFEPGERKHTTHWVSQITEASKFRTPLDALVIALQYDGSVIRYNNDNRSWSRLSDAELAGDFG